MALVSPTTSGEISATILAKVTRDPAICAADSAYTVKADLTDPMDQRLRIPGIRRIMSNKPIQLTLARRANLELYSRLRQEEGG